MLPEHISASSEGGSSQPSPSLKQCHASHLRHVLPLLTAGHSLTPGPFCALLGDGLMSSLFVRCTLFRNHQMEFDTLHLPAAVGVCGPSGAPKSDRECGEVENRCRPARGSGSSILSLTGGGYTVGPLWPWVCLTSQVGGVCCGFPVLGDQLPIHPVCPSKQGMSHCCLVRQRMV